MSKVSFDEFREQVAFVLKIEETQNLESPLGDIPQFDSMGKITVSLLIEDLFDFQIDYEVLARQTSLKALYDYCLNP
jgi:acyl carrier protein